MTRRCSSFNFFFFSFFFFRFFFRSFSCAVSLCDDGACWNISSAILVPRAFPYQKGGWGGGGSTGRERGCSSPSTSLVLFSPFSLALFRTKRAERGIRRVSRGTVDELRATGLRASAGEACYPRHSLALSGRRRTPGEAGMKARKGVP